MTDTARVLHHIAELYAKPRKEQPFDDAVLELEEKLSNRFDAYDSAFAEELTANIIKAVDDFWRFKSDKARPTIAQIMAMVNSNGQKAGDEDPENQQNMRARILKCADELGEKYGKSVRDKYLANYPDYDFSSHSWKEPKMLPLRNGIADYAVSLMQRDIRLGSCRHLLPVYQKAVRYVAEELLLEVIPSEQWRHMTYGERCKAAKEQGLFDRLSEVLVQVCRQHYGKDYQFESKSQMNQQFDMTDKIKRIASHYRTDEAEMARAAGL